MAATIDKIQSQDTYQINGKTFTSRLLVGTGKYATHELMAECLEASGTEMVTVALRRIPLDKKNEKNLLDFIDLKKYTLLPNTAGCYSAEEAIRVAHLARAAGLSDFIKLEVLFDEKTLLPDPLATLEATKILVKEGFTVMTYTSDDPVMAQKLEQAGAHAVMPAGSPIGSGQGVLNPNNIRIILEKLKCPVLIDAGVGSASDVAFAMELGVVAVLLNTAIAHAKDPLKMAYAMKNACEAGRLSYRAGRIPKKLYAQASTPDKDF
ncbi:MAG TPA: thiazole synthase [bacterium]|nr:thiazole synthase [bacterium]